MDRNTILISKTSLSLLLAHPSSSLFVRLTTTLPLSGMPPPISLFPTNVSLTTPSWASLASTCTSSLGCTSCRKSRLPSERAGPGGFDLPRSLSWLATGSCSDTVFSGVHFPTGLPASSLFSSRTLSPCRYMCKSLFHTGECRQSTSARASHSPSANSEQPWTSTAQPGSTLSTAVSSSKPCTTSSPACLDTTSARCSS